MRFTVWSPVVEEYLFRHGRLPHRHHDRIKVRRRAPYRSIWTRSRWWVPRPAVDCLAPLRSVSASTRISNITNPTRWHVSWSVRHPYNVPIDDDAAAENNVEAVVHPVSPMHYSAARTRFRTGEGVTGRIDLIAPHRPDGLNIDQYGLDRSRQQDAAHHR